MAEVNAGRDQAVSRAKAAAILGLHPITLSRMALRGDGPPFITLDGKRPTYRYPLDWLDQWRSAKAE